MVNRDKSTKFGGTLAMESEQEQATITASESRSCIGRLGAPTQKEATSTNFFFWIPDDKLVEKTQIITCESTLAGETYRFHGIVDEVYRQSHARTMRGERDEADGELDHEPPFHTNGFTYAAASILRSSVFAPPQERSRVYLANEEDARIAYGAEDIKDDAALEI